MMPTEEDSAPADEGDEDAQLRGCAQQQALGIGDQGAEVSHGTYAHEDEAGIDAQLDAQVQDINEAHGDSNAAERYTAGGGELLRCHQGLDLDG